MRVIISGQRSFGEAALRAAIDGGHEVVLVSSPPGDRLGRAASALGVPYIYSGSLTADTAPEFDVGVCAHSHDYVGKRLRYRARLGWVGYHPSLLPIHRGRDAVKWAVKMGDRVTGGSVYWLDGGVDTGPIAAQEFCLIEPGETASDLWREKLFPMGIRLLSSVLSDISAGILTKTPQNEACATWEPSLNPPRLARPDALMLPPPRYSAPPGSDTSRAAIDALDIALNGPNFKNYE